MIEDVIKWGAAGLALLFSFVKIPKIEINIWGLIGRALNGETLKRLTEIEAKLDRHLADEEREKADASRRRILDFSGELVRSIEHTEESFNDVLGDIDGYERYCAAHPDYPNNKAVLAIANIKKTYQTRLAKREFLKEV